MKIGFIGGGNIAQAIISGIILNGFSPENISFCDSSAETKAMVSEKYGTIPKSSIEEVHRDSDVIFFAVKPYILESVLLEIREFAAAEPKLLVSIAATKSLEFIGSILNCPVPTARIMPNINASVGESMTWATYNPLVSGQQKEIVKSIVEQFGGYIEIEESQDAVVSALCGSTPAFGYLFVEALAKGAHKLGLNKKEALRLAAQTMLGSAKLILETGEHPNVLADRVCTPGGTTIDGVCKLDEKAFTDTVVAGYEAIVEKTERLAKKK